MPSTFQHIDLNLCRQILFRTMEVMASSAPTGPANYEFDGHGPENVEFNMRKLHDFGLVEVRQKSERSRGQLGCWPELLYDKGLAFIESARDDKVWQKALQMIDESGQTPTLKRVRLHLSNLG